MSVLIKGIDIPKKHHMNCYYIDDDGKVFDVSRKNVVGKAVQISSAEPERKIGKWLRSGSCIFPYECDQCGDTNERSTPFCPNCGADMREVDHESN